LKIARENQKQGPKGRQILNYAGRYDDYQLYRSVTNSQLLN